MATIDEIKQQAAAVKNATQVGENTAERVGGALSGLSDIAEQQDSKLSGLRTLLSTNQFIVLGKKDGYIFNESLDFITIYPAIVLAILKLDLIAFWLITLSSASPVV